jgi:hypothetical protein
MIDLSGLGVCPLDYCLAVNGEPCKTRLGSERDPHKERLSPEKMVPAEPISLSDLYVVADYGYHGDPGCDGYAYTKEAAQAKVDGIKKTHPKLRHSVMDLQSYISENRRYQRHSCEIC